MLTVAVGVNQEEAAPLEAVTSLPVAPAIEEVPQTVVPEVVVRESFSAKMSKVSAPFNKYEAVIDRESFSPADEEYPTWHELIFGKEKTSFQLAKDRFLARQQGLQSQRRRYKLGQSGAATSNLSTIDGTMWTGQILMGSQGDPIDVIFDTASDWLSVESNLCANCQGNTFTVSESTTAT